MKINRKNKSKFNNSIKRPTSNNKKNLNLIPLFVQITKKNMIHSQNKDEESSLNQKKKNLNINNSINNNNMHSSSSLYINFISPINKNINKNKPKKYLINNESMKNKMILTSVDNSSLIGSKEKILSYNQNNNQNKKNVKQLHQKQESINNIILNGGIYAVGGKKNSKNKKYPLTSLNSRKNSVERKKSNKSLLQKYQQYYNKNSNRNKVFQSTNVNTCSNKNLLPNNNLNNKIMFGFSCFNNYIKNSKIQKAMNRKNKNNSTNISHFLFNNINKKYPNKNILSSNKNSSNTAKVSPRTSFINTNSKSLKIINNTNKNPKEENKEFIHVIKNKSKINEIIKNINIGKNYNNKNKNSSKNKVKNNTNYNSFNNFYNNFVLNNNNANSGSNVNNNSNICYNNLENILNNCQTTSGAFYNNYNININNQINNHIIYNNSNSRKKLNNNINFINNKINRIISQSQQEILQIKKNIKKHFTSNNSPNKILNYKIISSKKLKSNNHNEKKKNNNIFFLFNNDYSNKNSKNKLKNKNNNYNRRGRKYKGLRNQEKIKKNSKIKSKSTEKLNMQFQIKSLKNELIINDGNNDNNKDNLNNISKINNNKIKSCGKLDMHNNKEEEIKKTNNNETIKKNIYMEDSLKLSNYIKDYYKKNKEYPSTNIDFYKYGRLIGQGAFGKVNLGLNVLTGRVVAIKSFNKKNLNSPNNENMKKIIYETNLMKKLNHPNITKILEMFEDEKYILIIMEYINGGNLFSFVKKRRKLTEKISKILFKQIILGIKHIHSQNIVHRDVKLENILIDLNNTIKICDFGIGRILSSQNELLHDQCGTPMYMAPEILTCSKEKGYKGFPVDIWSAGIALYIMLSGALPFSVKNENDSFLDGNNNNNKRKNIALKKAIINNVPKRIEKISDNARDLLHGLLNKDPEKRMTCDEILNHPWLNNEEINNKNSKHHLFTKAEMIMLSKTYIDYRKANMEELQENFTISNLKRDKDINNNDKNVTTKSFILTPYNSLICGDDDSIEEIEKYIDSEFDDFNNTNINLENELISFNNRVKEFNMLYELNNNNEVDNGMLINTKINSVASWSIANGIINDSVVKTESVFCVEEGGNKDDNNDEFDNRCEKKVIIQNKQIKSQEISDKENDNKILNKIEDIGYDKKYVKKCLENNILCHATSIYFLLKNYDKIE